MSNSGQFQKGHVANPSGRPKGSANKYTEFRKMAESDAPEIIKKVIQMALDGDLVAAKLVLERIWPATAEKDIRLEEKLDQLQEQLDRLEAER